MAAISIMRMKLYDVSVCGSFRSTLIDAFLDSRAVPSNLDSVREHQQLLHKYDVTLQVEFAFITKDRLCWRLNLIHEFCGTPILADILKLLERRN